MSTPLRYRRVQPAPRDGQAAPPAVPPAASPTATTTATPVLSPATQSPASPVTASPPVTNVKPARHFQRNLQNAGPVGSPRHAPHPRGPHPQSPHLQSPPYHQQFGSVGSPYSPSPYSSPSHRLPGQSPLGPVRQMSLSERSAERAERVSPDADINSRPRLASPPATSRATSPEDGVDTGSPARAVHRGERAERMRGRVPEDFRPNQDTIEKLIAATRSAQPATPKSPGKPPLPKYAVPIRLPTRQVAKSIDQTTTALSLAAQLVREHRLEFDFENNEEGDDDSLLIWECFDGTRRPLRSTELVLDVVRRWTGRTRYYLRTTSTSLRDDVDSLASLAPRRDMLRAPPTILGAEVNFSRPSVMYNPHANQQINRTAQSPEHTPARRPSLHQSPAASPPVGSPKDNDEGTSLARLPSKLNPSDKLLRVRRLQQDNDDVVLQSQLVWGFGSLDLVGGRVVLKQKPGDELVCSLEAAGSDVYEWPHPGPKKYVVVLKAQQPHSQAVYISTDSAKVYSLVRNAVYTARSRALRYQKPVSI